MYAAAPLVDRFKFNTRGAFLTTVCEALRQEQDGRPAQLAYFNGDGYVAWEDVWGAWNGLTPRDGETLQRAAAVLRFWGAAAAAVLPRCGRVELAAALVRCAPEPPKCTCMRDQASPHCCGATTGAERACP